MNTNTMKVHQGNMSRFARFGRLVFGGVLALGMFVAAPALGQTSDPMGWDVDSIIMRCAENVCRRYNLNDEQCAQTHKIFEKEVNKFIDENSKELWPLMRDMIQVQNGELPSKDAAESFGRRAEGMMGKIENAIKDANMRWREILTPEQKKLHDWDLSQMDGTFLQIKKNVEDIKAGKQDVKQFIPQTPAKGAGMPERPSKPKPGIPSLRDDIRPEDEWTQYVKQFISDYELDEAQAAAAKTILAELLERANNYRESKKDEIVAAERDAQDLLGKDRATQLAASDRLKELLEPLKKYRSDLETRLNTIPRDAQRAKFEGRTGGSAAGSTDESPAGAAKRRVVEPPAEKSDGDDAGAGKTASSDGVDEKSASSSDAKPRRGYNRSVERKAKPNE